MNPIPKLYLDTSVIGGCFDPEFERYSQQLIKEIEIGLFYPFVSELTEIEISRAPEPVVLQFMKLIDMGCEILPITEEVEQLAQEYVRRKILSRNFIEDAVHIAVATINVMDILVSWNFKHIVHYHKIRMFNAVNIEHGYHPLTIFSPREVIHYED